jgi:DNA gyrase subunit B
MEQLEHDPLNPEVQYVEIYESAELEKLAQQLEKLGLGLSMYFRLGKNEELRLSDDKKIARNCLNLEKVLREVREEGQHGMHIQRYKGLGEMNPQQLWETTMDPVRRTILKVTMEDSVQADLMFTTLMGEEVEPRKQFIEDHALEVKELDI